MAQLMWSRFSYLFNFDRNSPSNGDVACQASLRRHMFHKDDAEDRWRSISWERAR
jgi:hypothetical protein